MKKKAVRWVYVVLMMGCLMLFGLTALSWGANKAEEELIVAAEKGDLPQVKSLIAAGVDVNAKGTKYGDTALMVACYKGHVEVVKALLAAKADVNAKDNDDFTALIEASGYGIEQGLLSLTSGSELDKSEVAKYHKVAIEMVRALLAAKADVNAKNNFGITALINASQNGHIEVVQALLAAKANVNAKTNDGGTALMAASHWGYVEVVKALLAAKADVNARDKYGMTALMYASDQGRDEVVKLLREARAKA